MFCSRACHRWRQSRPLSGPILASSFFCQVIGSKLSMTSVSRRAWSAGVARRKSSIMPAGLGLRLRLGLGFGSYVLVLILIVILILIPPASRPATCPPLHEVPRADHPPPLSQPGGFSDLPRGRRRPEFAG